MKKINKWIDEKLNLNRFSRSQRTMMSFSLHLISLVTGIISLISYFGLSMLKESIIARYVILNNQVFTLISIQALFGFVYVLLISLTILIPLTLVFKLNDYPEDIIAEEEREEAISELVEQYRNKRKINNI